MTKKEIKLLLECYVNGVCTSNEERRVEARLCHVKEESDCSWNDKRHLQKAKQCIAGKIGQTVSVKLRRQLPAENVITLPEQIGGVGPIISDGLVDLLYTYYSLNIVINAKSKINWPWHAINS